ncbi:hypothetical protein QG37_06891 [Candidozyma auris]|nr:hypothetical protein QG37_06891 [[Candida] auris]
MMGDGLTPFDSFMAICTGRDMEPDRERGESGGGKIKSGLRSWGHFQMRLTISVDGGV